MTSLQCLNKILNTKKFDIVIKYALDRTYFAPYEEEFDFINNHFNEYGNVPDKETFFTQFPQFDNFEVNESDDFLIRNLQEEHLYSMIVPVLEKSADLLKGNSNDAVAYLMNHVNLLNRNVGVGTTDIIHRTGTRLDTYLKKANGDQKDFCISTGFHELDSAIQGWARGEELVILFARTNQGKSWILTKCMAQAWHEGFNVGFVSPEMSADKIGYRFDTLFNHFDNTALNWGKDVNGYAEYLDDLHNSPASFYVSTPRDFGNKITVSKLKTFVENNNIQILAVDGISYLEDERKGRSDNRQAELTHISEDLFQLSCELHIPILGVVQANRDGVKVNGGNLELENIRDADGIAYNASKVIAIRQKVDEEILELTVKKNRDGMVGGKFTYQWIPNTGDFNYIPEEEDGNDDEDREAKTLELRDHYERNTTKIEF